MARARAELGYREKATYAEALSNTLTWALDASAGRDWREVFTTLAKYPIDLFDYAAEDSYLEIVSSQREGP